VPDRSAGQWKSVGELIDRLREDEAFRKRDLSDFAVECLFLGAIS
jgi:hypothetical protein